MEVCCSKTWLRVHGFVHGTSHASYYESSFNRHDLRPICSKMLNVLSPLFSFPASPLGTPTTGKPMLLPPKLAMQKKIQKSYLTRYIVTLQDILEPELVLRSELALERKSWGQLRPRHWWYQCQLFILYLKSTSLISQQWQSSRKITAKIFLQTQPLGKVAMNFFAMSFVHHKYCVLSILT